MSFVGIFYDVAFEIKEDRVFYMPRAGPWSILVTGSHHSSLHRITSLSFPLHLATQVENTCGLEVDSNKNPMMCCAYESCSILESGFRGIDGGIEEGGGGDLSEGDNLSYAGKSVAFS